MGQVSGEPNDFSAGDTGSLIRCCGGRRKKILDDIARRARGDLYCVRSIEQGVECNRFISRRRVNCLTAREVQLVMGQNFYEYESGYGFGTKSIRSFSKLLLTMKLVIINLSSCVDQTCRGDILHGDVFPVTCVIEGLHGSLKKVNNKKKKVVSSYKGE